MEKVRLWCGQPSDRGRLKNGTVYWPRALASQKMLEFSSTVLSTLSRALVMSSGMLRRDISCRFIIIIIITVSVHFCLAQRNCPQQT